MDECLPLPAARCLSKEQAADYLGIGVILLMELDVPYVKFGRRCVFDKVDLDTWLDEYKRRERGRAVKEKTLWPVKPESIDAGIPAIGGLQQPFRTAGEYAKVLGLKTGKTPKRY